MSELFGNHIVGFLMKQLIYIYLPVSYGGTEAGLEHAQYIFSQDANSPDTKR